MNDYNEGFAKYYGEDGLFHYDDRILDDSMRYGQEASDAAYLKDLVKRIIPAGHAEDVSVKFPGITRVQFNLKTTAYKRNFAAEPKITYVRGQKRAIYPYIYDANGKKITAEIDPMLTTIVNFDDGTKVVVTNSPEDHVELTDVKLADGSTVKAASEASKERAILYAIVKRLYGTPNARGEIEEVGLARKLGNAISCAYDTNVEAAKNAVKEAARKKKAAECKVKKPAKKRYSAYETLERINALLNRIEASKKHAAFDLENDMHG